MGPYLFIFFIAATMATWRSSHSYNMCVGRCKVYIQLIGRRPMTKCDLEIEVLDIEYADDIVYY